MKHNYKYFLYIKILLSITAFILLRNNNLTKLSYEFENLTTLYKL